MLGSTNLFTVQEFCFVYSEVKLDGVVSNVFWDLFVSAVKEKMSHLKKTAR